MKQSSIFSAQKSTSSQILCCALERSINIRTPTKLGRKGLKGSQLIKATETVTVSMESRLNSSGIVHKNLGVVLRTKCCWNSQKADILFFRATTPLSRSKLKSKGHGKLSIHFTADYSTIETIFRIIISANQLSVFTEQWRICVKNLKPIKIDRENLMY